MSKHAEADLILKLFELRREATMRTAREWYFLEFNPESRADFDKIMIGEHGGYLRMIISYWDMAAALVNHGAIGVDFFNDTNGEHLGVFAKLEPLLDEIRPAYGPHLAANLEKLIDATPSGRERVAAVRERMKAMRAEIAGTRTGAIAQS
jgi:hypothetical protein